MPRSFLPMNAKSESYHRLRLTIDTQALSALKQSLPVAKGAMGVVGAPRAVYSQPSSY
jgi:hypothetical protein